MIRVRFDREQGALAGVSVTGHAGYADRGEDIVCAAVTSAVQLTANGITEILGIPMPVTVRENLVEYHLPKPGDQQAIAFLEALKLHLEIISRDYEKTIQITVTEV